MDTIAAVSTGREPAAIGILRLSGPKASAILDAVFRPADGKALSAHPRRELVCGTLLDREGRVLDRCMAVTFAAGHSYTGEDSGELHCHGSPVVLSEGLAALFAAGARQAGRGEFTRRAFLNGRMDLTQAEAVADLIEADTAPAAVSAAAMLGGALRRRTQAVYDALLELAGRFYAVVDYPDEDLGDVTREEIDGALENAQRELDALLATADRGRALRLGIPAAILGRPNAGKSSLLNALLGYERSIVTDIPGTTRDTVEEKAAVGGVPLRLIDTAGLREGTDAVERLGVDRAKEAAARAGLLLAVIDGSRERTAEDGEVLRLCAGSGKPWIYVLSKRDLSGVAAVSLEPTEGTAPAAAVSVSSRTGEGLEELERAVAALFPAGSAPAGELLANERQAEAAGRAREAVSRGRAALKAGLTPDAALADVEEAMAALGELTGRTVREDVVERIFERFCVGK